MTARNFMMACAAFLCLMPLVAAAQEARDGLSFAMPVLTPYQQAAIACSRAVFPRPRADDPPEVKARYGKWTPGSRAEYERCMAEKGMTDADVKAFMKSRPYKIVQPDRQAQAAERQALEALTAAPATAPVPAAGALPAPAVAVPVIPPPSLAPATDKPAAAPPAAAPQKAMPAPIFVRPGGTGGEKRPKPIYLPGGR